MNNIPKIDLSKCNLSPDEYALAQGIINRKTGELRASKPFVPRKVQIGKPDDYGIHEWAYKTEEDANRGRTAYIWRMVAFHISPISQHQCMPIMSDMDLPGWHNERGEEMKRMDEIIDKIINSLPAGMWLGVRRWGRALGY